MKLTTAQKNIQVGKDMERHDSRLLECEGRISTNDRLIHTLGLLETSKTDISDFEQLSLKVQDQVPTLESFNHWRDMLQVYMNDTDKTIVQLKS